MRASAVACLGLGAAAAASLVAAARADDARVDDRLRATRAGLAHTAALLLALGAAALAADAALQSIATSGDRARTRLAVRG